MPRPPGSAVGAGVQEGNLTRLSLERFGKILESEARVVNVQERKQDLEDRQLERKRRKEEVKEKS